MGFRVDPHPGRVQGLAKFVLQVMSKEHGPIGLVRSKATWKTSSQRATVNFNKLSKVDWEEGWHFVRVLPQTVDGDLISLVDEAGSPLPWAPERQRRSGYPLERERPLLRTSGRRGRHRAGPARGTP